MSRVFREVHRLDSHRNTLGVPPEQQHRADGYRAGLLAAVAIGRGTAPEHGEALYAAWLAGQGASLPPCTCPSCQAVREVVLRMEADPHVYDQAVPEWAA
ncbi:hypothetical protein [Streptomyces sp. NPDC004042]|uniref:hypothetical protein n=1 Tax=Streptomyces sp. NPDC004042 TaxID=3154451 RepID=UPI0033A2B8F7